MDQEALQSEINAGSSDMASCPSDTRNDNLAWAPKRRLGESTPFDFDFAPAYLGGNPDPLGVGLQSSWNGDQTTIEPYEDPWAFLSTSDGTQNPAGHWYKNISWAPPETKKFICRPKLPFSGISKNEMAEQSPADKFRREQVPESALPQPACDIPPQVPRTCQWAGCCEQRVFQQDSAFRRHMNKHERPYKCHISNCKAKDFTNSGDLKRHQRTVHGKGIFFCPFPSCKRRTKGFGRKDNREEHLRRVHALEGSITSDSPEDQVVEENDVEGADREVCTPMSDDEVLVSPTRTPSFAVGKLSLAAKLQELKDAKVAALAELVTKFDKDIEAVERVMALS